MVYNNSMVLNNFTALIDFIALIDSPGYDTGWATSIVMVSTQIISSIKTHFFCHTDYLSFYEYKESVDVTVQYGSVVSTQVDKNSTGICAYIIYDI